MTEAPRSYPGSDLARRLAAEIERYDRRPYRTPIDRFSFTLNEIETPLMLSLLRPVAQGQPNLKQIEAAIDDHLGNIDATYEDSRRRCAQSILNLYAVPSTESK